LDRDVDGDVPTGGRALLLAFPSDEDAIPAIAPAPVTRLGDVWTLGSHRLMCGDSTDATQIATLMEGHPAALCFTSPPYGNQRHYSTGGISDWDALMQGVFSAAPVADTAQVLVNLGMIHRESEWHPYWEGWIAWMRAQGWRRFGWYVWDQGPGLPGDWNGRLAPSHEFVFHFNKVAERARKTKKKLAENMKFDPNSGTIRKADGSTAGGSNPGASMQSHKIPDSVIRVTRHKARGIETGHPAVFPVQLVVEMLTAFSDPGAVVYEPFCGSGTSLIGAEKTERICRAMELAPAYCDIAVRRWQAYTGALATNQDGMTYTETAAARGIAAAV
ncbi:MAG: site-specific DNA-methyltransferase, partial [Bacteroidia bacterium]